MMITANTDKAAATTTTALARGDSRSKLQHCSFCRIFQLDGMSRFHSFCRTPRTFVRRIDCGTIADMIPALVRNAK
jgi:hypothetical protein